MDTQTPERRRSRTAILVAAVAALGLSMTLLVPSALAEHDDAGPAVTPTPAAFPGGDPVCLEGVGIRFQNQELTDGFSKGGVTLTDVDVDGGTLSFEVAAPNLAAMVFVKGGTVMNIYDYSGFPGGGVAHDDGLTTPINPSNDKPFGLSHVDFCVVEADEEETATPTPTPEETVAGETSTPTPSPEQTVLGATGTPAPSQPDTAMGAQGGPSPIPTAAFAMILLAALGTLAWANVKTVRSRA
jgi:hypothetical protein